MLCFVLVGLYFFGDFRVNEVNVRDFLRQKITWQQIESAKVGVVQVYRAVKGLIEAVSPDGATPNASTNTGMTLGTIPTTLDTNKLMQGLPLDQISAKDREKLKELITKTINESSKNPKSK